MKTYQYKSLRGCGIHSHEDYVEASQRNQWGPRGRGYEGLFGLRLAVNSSKGDVNEIGGPAKGRTGGGEGVAVLARTVQQD